MSGKKVQSAYCGHTMLTARCHTGVEFPAAPRLAFFCSALVVAVGSHRHTTFQLLVFKVRQTIATGGKHRLWTFDNLPPRFPFGDRLCLRRQPQVVKKARAAQLQPMGRPEGLNDPSLKHAAGAGGAGGTHMAGCVYPSGLTKTASERGWLGSFWRALPTEQDYSEVCPEVREQGGK